MISCIKNKLKINHVNSKVDTQLDNIVGWENMNNELLSDMLTHGHESLYDLEKKFGNNFPIVSVKRNRHERFISLWKHIIDETFIINDIKTFKILQKLNTDDILFYNSDDIVDNKKIDIISKTFFIKNNLTESSTYFKNIFSSILIKPYSFYHHHDKRVIWFDFNELYKLENWASNILNIDFKLEKINSSQNFECELSLDNHFIKKYNKIYDVYDFKKELITLI
jgi:hypothetical protein